jgi:UDPglucose--hexose-1-phosphate uridylyltransferase
MSELRQNLATKEWYIIAKERAKRPLDFNLDEKVREHQEYSTECPFCPGNESLARETAHELKINGEWVVKSVPNKYSALTPEGNRDRTASGVYRKMPGVGYHEVIIESNLHNDNYHKMSIEHIEQILKIYIHRYVEFIKDDRIEDVIIFKNYGPSAGSSLAHPHSQIIATPIVSTPTRSTLESAKRYYDDHGRCAYCQMIDEEMKEETRLVSHNDDFVVFCPYASGTPFETWIVPKRHRSDFCSISDGEIKGLATIIKDIFSRYYHGLGDPDFNFVIKTPPKDESNDRSFHWYIQILPKITKIAGFELGSGMSINITIPEENAEFLRSVSITKITEQN